MSKGQFSGIIWTNADLSQTSLTSAVTDIRYMDNIGIELVCALTASATATFTAGSAETDTITINGTTVTIAGTGVAATDAAALLAAINANATLNTVVIATQGSTSAKVFIQSPATGTAGNAYTVTATGTNIAVTGSGTFTAGTAPTGTFVLNTCNDYKYTLGGTGSGGTWVPVTLSATPTCSGASTNIYIALNQIPGPWIQMVWTNQSGAGLIQGSIHGKAV